MLNLLLGKKGGGHAGGEASAEATSQATAALAAAAAAESAHRGPHHHKHRASAGRPVAGADIVFAADELQPHEGQEIPVRASGGG